MDSHSSKMPAKCPNPLCSHLRIDSLKQLTACLLEKNKEVVRVILDCKEEIRKNPELLVLVQDYFDKGLHTLDFCNALHKCFENAQNSQLLLQHALLHLEEVEPALKYEKFEGELNRFKESVDLFTKEFLCIFQLVHQHQISKLEPLLVKKKRLDKKLKLVKTSRKLFSIIFALASAVLLIFSVVSVTVGAPPIPQAILAVCSAMRALFHFMWNNCREAIEQEKMIISALKDGTCASINEMDEFRAMMNTLEDQTSYLVEKAELNFSDEEAVRSVMEEIGKKMELFMKNIEALVAQADQCRQDIERPRTVLYDPIDA
ncbi:hypothetical protein IEQ34_002742 [Dendrobium chrysotoxum]|uniref:Uncharacterized protein n=1 Tax=Dendrobium chrysotoxum TaxID=161865 RepID=A0AAV7HHU9_DENCH|nr:hypothetical protein IEQ34_002742 [Dendrobium chrysotoxum]